jgi:hypothetical protein
VKDNEKIINQLALAQDLVEDLCDRKQYYLFKC